MSSSWAGGCPCKDCNFKTKNSYPLVNYIRNCSHDYVSKEATEKRAEELLPVYYFCREAKRCLHEGCDFRSTVPWDIMSHMQKCSLPIDNILFSEGYVKFTHWEAARGKKLSL